MEYVTKPISKFCSTDIYQWCRRWKKNFLARCLLLIGSISASVRGCEIHNASAWTRLLCTRMWPRSIPARKPTGGCTFIITHTHTHIILQNISKHRHMSNSSLFRQNIVLVSSDVDFMTSQDFYTANLGLNPAVTHSSLVLTNCIQPKLFLCTWDLDCMGAHLSLHDKEQRDTKRPYVTLRTADAVKVHCLWHVSCLQ